MRSMTGYGHGVINSPLGSIEVSIKSLNHRFFSINVHLPEIFEPFEIQINDLIKRQIERGRIECRLSWEPIDGLGPRPGVNGRVIEAYLSGLKEAGERYGLSGEIDIGIVSGLPGIFSFEKGKEPDRDLLWSAVSQAIEQALEGLIEMREREGEVIQRSIRGMLDQIGMIHRAIEELAPARIEKARRKTHDRLKELLAGKEIDETRVLMEVTLLADRLDISEELARILSHLIQFEKTIESGRNIGRRLHFLLQELLREVNTIASKAYDVEISHRAVEIKEIIEQLREQVENVE